MPGNCWENSRCEIGPQPGHGSAAALSGRSFLCCDAVLDTYDILDECHAEEMGGVIHCFSASAEMAERYVKKGFFIGIGGVVTFKNAKTMKEVAARTPIENIVLETDCPYLAPVPFRGKRNYSGYLNLVAETIAEIKGISKEEVCDKTYENAKRLYRLS